MRLEDAVLLGVREARVQRQYLGEPVLLLLQSVRGVPDLPLTGEEDEDVALALALKLLHGVADGGDLIAVGVVGVLFEERAVAHLHGVRPPADLHDRGVAEMPGEPLGVDGRGGDHDLEIGPARQQLRQIPEQEVDVQGPLVRLVDDDRVVGAQLTVGLDLGEQDAVRHQLDEGGLRIHLVGEADLPADGLAERCTQFLGDPLGDGTGGDPAGLGVPDHAPHTTPELHTDLRNLRGLAGPGLTGHDDDLMITDCGRDLVLLLADRQLLGVRDGRHPGPPLPHALLGLRHLALDLGEHSGASLRLSLIHIETGRRPIRCASRKESSVRRGARAPRAGAGCVDIRDPGSHPTDFSGERFCPGPASLSASGLRPQSPQGPDPNVGALIVCWASE